MKNLLSLFKNDSRNGNKIDRYLINGVLTKLSEWFNTNSEEIRVTDSDVIPACLGN